MDEEGRQLGIVPLREALRIAGERGLDVVEVAPQASPVVCRIMDYGRFKYEQEKREREARRRQHLIEVKELVLKKYTIDPHDLETVARKGERILRAGDKLKVTLRFRGREIVHVDLGRDVFKRLVSMLSAVAQVESEPRLEGRSLIMTLTPRPEVQRAVLEARRGGAARAASEGGPGAVASPPPHAAVQPRGGQRAGSPAAAASGPAPEARPRAGEDRPVVNAAAPVTQGRDGAAAGVRPGASEPGSVSAGAAARAARPVPPTRPVS